VNAVTTPRSDRRRRDATTRATRKAMWSYPERMCSKPIPTNCRKCPPSLEAARDTQVGSSIHRSLERGAPPFHTIWAWSRCQGFDSPEEGELDLQRLDPFPRSEATEEVDVLARRDDPRVDELPLEPNPRLRVRRSRQPIPFQDRPLELGEPPLELVGGEPSVPVAVERQRLEERRCLATKLEPHLSPVDEDARAADGVRMRCAERHRRRGSDRDESREKGHRRVFEYTPTPRFGKDPY
jgi:hypothetical protein